MTCYEPLMRAAFDCLCFELGRLASTSPVGAPMHAMRSVARAAEQFSVAMFEGVTLAPFEVLSHEAAGLVHDAYMRVLALADLLADARDASWADPDDVVHAYDTAVDFLDALAPCVSRADQALRRVTLDEITSWSSPAHDTAL